MRPGPIRTSCKRPIQKTLLNDRDLVLHIAKYHMILPTALEEVFDFFSDAIHLEQITPPELRFHIVSPTPISMAQGTRIDYRLRLYGIPLRWRAFITQWNPPFGFVDEQVRGPFRLWVHTHRFTVLEKTTRIDDEVQYILPFSPLGDVIFPFIRTLIDRIFAFRKRTIQGIFGEKWSRPI